jgi:hypothetical protein
MLVENRRTKEDGRCDDKHFKQKLVVAGDECLPVGSCKLPSMGREAPSRDSSMYKKCHGKKAPWHFFWPRCGRARKSFAETNPRIIFVKERKDGTGQNVIGRS